MCTAVEGDGLQTLTRDLRCSGIIYRISGETFEQFCARIAAEYYLRIDTARAALEHLDQ